MVNFKFVSNKVVDNFTLSDIVKNHGTISSDSFPTNGDTFTIKYYPSSQGVSKLTVPAGRFSDAFGNENLAAEFSYIYDSSIPTVTTTIASNNTSNSYAKIDDVVTLTMVFNEVVNTPNVKFIIDGTEKTATVSGSNQNW